MKYIYIVTSIVFNNHPGITFLPNLGVLTSYRSALRHFRVAVKDRELRSKGLGVGYTQLGNRPIPYPEQYTVLAEMHFPDERVRLEKWKVK